MEKRDLCKGYWNPQRKIGVAVHFFEIISLEFNNNADISIFLNKEGQDISSHISLEFALTYRQAKTFIKILKLHGKWCHENHFFYFFDNKIVAAVLLVKVKSDHRSKFSNLSNWKEEA